MACNGRFSLPFVVVSIFSQVFFFVIGVSKLEKLGNQRQILDTG